MATGPEALAALQQATRDLPAGSEHWVSVLEKLDLCKLRVSDLTSRSFDQTVAEEVVGRLNHQDVSRLGTALGLRLRVKFKIWAERSGNMASIRCEGEDNARWLLRYLQDQFASTTVTEPEPNGDPSFWKFTIEFGPTCTPADLRAVLAGCPAIVPIRVFPVSIDEQPHFLLQSFNLASWIEDQGNEVWWTADGDPLLMSRLEFPAPPDELSAAIRDIGRPLLVADPGRSAHGEELTPAEINRAIDSDDWGNRRLLLKWQGATVDWVLIEDTPASVSSTGL